MDVEEGTSNGEGGEGGECSKVPLNSLKSETLTNGFEIGVIHDSNDVKLGGSEISVRTYKRRKQTRSSLESKQPEHDRDYVEVASQMEDKKNGRNVVLEHIYQSFSNDGAIRSCIRDTLNQPLMESNISNVDRILRSFKKEQMANRTQVVDEAHVGVIPNGHSVDSTVTEMCQRSFVNVINSEKFSLLCELLTENFQGLNGESVFPLGIMNSRMTEGVYEHSPLLFSTDIQQVWRKIQKIGNDMVSLAKSLTDISTTSYSEQFGCPVPCTLEEEKDEARVSGSLAKAENPVAESVCRINTCKQCGKKAEGLDCLVCDSCEEMQHVSCIVPVVKEIPLKSWYCANCTNNGIGSPHDHCVLCDKMNAPKAVNNLVEEIEIINEDTFIEAEDDSNCNMDVDETKNFSNCKICGVDVEENEKFRICDHSECLHKYYHERCLNMKQLKLYGPNWYCPSCLCRTCLVDEQDDMIVLCDGCDDAYHTYCLTPPLTAVPSGKWFCRKCSIGIEQIREAKAKYEMILEKGKERKKPDGKSEYEPNKKRKANSQLNRGGMDVLLNAVNYEEKMAGK